MYLRIRAVAVGFSASFLFTLPACTAVSEKLAPPPMNVALIVDELKIKEVSKPKQEPTPAVLNLPQTQDAASQGNPLPITLMTALSLSNANPLDIQIAEERIKAATAQRDRAEVMWLPNLNLGADYFRHDGQIQDIVGTVFTTSRSSFLLGAGPQLVVNTSDAIYAPLAARQVARAVQLDAQAVKNDTTLAVAIAYFNVQQARGDVAGSVDALRRADDLVTRITKLAPDFTPDIEVNRAKTEAARRRGAVESAYERWQVSSAELVRLLRLQPGTIVEPAEEPSLQLHLIDLNTPIDELIAVGLTHRPELSSHQSVVQAALARVKQEKRRPLYPTVSVRGVGSNTSGLAGGYFGGGVNDEMRAFGPRFSVDVQAVWEFQNLGFGNRELVREREADSKRALLELLRTQDMVTAEIVQARTQVDRAAKRIKAAEEAVANANQTAEKNLEGLGQTKRVGEQLVLVFRPLEAVAAVNTLDAAYRDYYQAIADHNRAQFRLYRALGHPGVALCDLGSPSTIMPTTSLSPAPN